MNHRHNRHGDSRPFQHTFSDGGRNYHIFAGDIDGRHTITLQLAEPHPPRNRNREHRGRERVFFDRDPEPENPFGMGHNSQSQNLRERALFDRLPFNGRALESPHSRFREPQYHHFQPDHSPTLSLLLPGPR